MAIGANSYGSVAEVQALTGKYLNAGVFTASTRPTLTQVEKFIDNASAVSIAMVRQMMWRMLSAPHPIDAHEVDTAGIAALGKSNDAREGIGAFLEKRKPNFKKFKRLP